MTKTIDDPGRLYYAEKLYMTLKIASSDIVYIEFL